MQCLEVKVMAKHHNAQGKQRNNINKRVSTLEREVKEMRANPIPPEQRMNMAAMSRPARPGEGRGDYLTVRPGNAEFGKPVAEHLGRLQGRSRSDVVSDRERQAGSPLGQRRR